MNPRRQPRFDEAAGPLVRPYAVTRGRTTGNRPELDLITLLLAMDTQASDTRRDLEYTEIMRICQTPKSVAEVAATLRLPLMVTKILLGDLISDGHLIARSAPLPTMSGSNRLDLLRTVLDGIRSL